MRAVDSARRSGSRDGGGDAGRDSSAVDSREDLRRSICDGRELLELRSGSGDGRFSSSVWSFFLTDFSFSSALFVASMRFRRFLISRSFFCFRSRSLSHRCFSFTSECFWSVIIQSLFCRVCCVSFSDISSIFMVPLSLLNSALIFRKSSGDKPTPVLSPCVQRSPRSKACKRSTP